jgi:hypothetical protein
MKPFLLCVLLGMSPAHVVHVLHVFKSQSVEFAKGQTFSCVKGKGGKARVAHRKSFEQEAGYRERDKYRRK